MIILTILLLLLCLLFGIGFLMTGAILSVILWVCVKLPLGLIACALGIGLCCTLILIPIGIGCLKAGLRLIIPGV